MALVFFGVLAALLFALAFFTRRRFGFLAFGLCAGVVLAEALDQDAAFVVEAVGINVPYFDGRALSYIVLTLVPAMVLGISGMKYLDSRIAFFSALGFAAFGVLLLLDTLSTHLPIDPVSKNFIAKVLQYKAELTAVFILIALADILSLKTPKFGKKH